MRAMGSSPKHQGHISKCVCVHAEPTNHLDLEACVWLEDVLSKFKRILLLVSHSQVWIH